MINVSFESDKNILKNRTEQNRTLIRFVQSKSSI